MAATYANSSNQIASLKELYKDDKEYMKDLVYKENPFLALVPKDESPDGFAGKYIPVPLEYGVPQGRSHTHSAMSFAVSFWRLSSSTVAHTTVPALWYLLSFCILPIYAKSLMAILGVRELEFIGYHIATLHCQLTGVNTFVRVATTITKTDTKCL